MPYRILTIQNVQCFKCREWGKLYCPACYMSQSKPDYTMYQLLYRPFCLGLHCPSSPFSWSTTTTSPRFSQLPPKSGSKSNRARWFIVADLCIVWCRRGRCRRNVWHGLFSWSSFYTISTPSGNPSKTRFESRERGTTCEKENLSEENREVRVSLSNVY